MKLGYLKAYMKSVLVDYWVVFLICPALFLFIFSNELNIIGLYGLVYRKQCLSQFNETICNNIHSFVNESVSVQENSSEKQMWMNISLIIPAIFAIVRFSGMGDKKLNYQVPLLVAVVGSILNTLILVIATDQDAAVCFTLIFVAQALNGICGGGSLCFISSCFSHISVYEERTNEKKMEQDAVAETKSNYKSIRFSICESSLLIGQFLGSLISGYLIGNKTELYGFRLTFYVSFAMYSAVFLYVICMFKYLNHSKITKITVKRTNDHEEDGQNILKKSTSIFKNEISFFTDTWHLLFKKRENNARFHIISLLLIYFVGASISLGLTSIQYLYLVKNSDIKLSQIDYGYFKAFNTLARAVSLLVVLPLLKFYSLPDYWFYLIGITSEFLNLIVYSVASSFSYLIWIAPVVYMFSNYFVVCIRIFASKLVDKNETGKIFGIIALVEFLVLLLSSSIITIVYKASIATFPPLIYIICTVICLVVCYPFLIYIIRDLQRSERSCQSIKNILLSPDADEITQETS